MEYRCNSVPLTAFITVTGTSVENSGLCAKCKSRDCTNPIEKKTISVLGINKSGHFLMRGNEPYVVLECEGFVGIDGNE